VLNIPILFLARGRRAIHWAVFCSPHCRNARHYQRKVKSGWIKANYKRVKERRKAKAVTA